MSKLSFHALIGGVLLLMSSAWQNTSMANESAEAANESLPLVTKQKFTMTDYQTVGGETIAEVTVGWESYGELNVAKDNVILITHFFSGNSHAAGKYQATDAQPGYWDAIIGPGKAIDTNQYFVISSDTLVNAFANDPNVITTGPASTNPATGKPYGLTFPVVTIKDFVQVQRALLDSLGIDKLHAVVGASMGSLQALEWAATYPDDVERMVSIIGAGRLDSWSIMGLEHWAQAIKGDPNWQQGNYYDSEPPLAGLTRTLAMITQDAMHPQIVNQLAPAQDVLPAKGLASVTNGLPATDWLFGAAAARAPLADANHILYLVRANQLFVAGHQQDLATGLAAVKAKTLFMPATNDLLLMPYLAEEAAEVLRSQGKDPVWVELGGPWGHLNGVFNIQSQAQALSDFLNAE